MDRNEIPYDPCHLGVPIGASKTIFEPMVRSVQTAHLSCTDSNSVSKRTEMRFHMTHVTYEFHSVHPKQFLSLWCIRCKLRTYLALWLALSLSPNGPKRASTLASSSRSTVGCIQKDFWASGSLAQTVQLSCTDTNTISKRTEIRFHMTHVT
jgi:hypothetical protein